MATYFEQSGGGRIHTPLLSSANDLGLDVACWSTLFPDARDIMHLWGQCATGEDWDEKLGDLNFELWKRHVTFDFPPLRFLAIPRVVPNRKDWGRIVTEAGLVLDRPRLLHLQKTSGLPQATAARVVEVCEELFAD